MSETEEPGREYLLANTGEEYFNVLKPSELYLSKLDRLKEFLPEAEKIVSIGTAGGHDLCRLSESYGEEVEFIGVDISPVAIELARRVTLAAGVEADFILSDTENLYFQDRSIDAFIMFAVLHEVYSYSEDGKGAFIRSVEEIFRKTSDGGCIYISDFAAPRIENPISLNPKSHEAEVFLKYFSSNFRRFKETNIDVGLSEPSTNGTSSIDLNGIEPAYASELLWHFKHFKKNIIDNTTSDTVSTPWKEINEIYLPPNPLVKGHIAMPIDEYIRTVIQIARNTDEEGEFSLSCVSAVLNPQRTEVIKMLTEHFEASDNFSSVSSEEIIIECTNWLDIIFRKELVKP